MKLKTIIFALCACSVSYLPAQNTPTAEPKADDAAQEFKAETPFEVRGFRVFDLVAAFPDALGSVKDEATAAIAQEKLNAIGTKLKAEAAEIKELPIPANEDRKKLDVKLKGKKKAMESKMKVIMEGMDKLDPAVGKQIMGMLMGFSGEMQELGPIMEKYFEPDPEPKEDK